MIAFGGLNWALDGAAAPVAAVLRLQSGDGAAGALPAGTRAAAGLPAREIRFRDVTFAYPGGDAGARSLRSDDSRRLVARDRRTERRRQDHARQAALPVCTTRSRARSRSTAWTCASWRSRLVAVARHRRLPGFHPLRAAAARQRRARPARRTRRCAPRSSRRAPANLAALDTVLARGYDGRHRSVGRAVAARRARAGACARLQLGAGVVLLDEPTAQLDVRGEAEIFERILAATRRMHDRS